MPSLITILREMPDPRTGNAQRHDLLDVLVIAVAASVCGAETCVDFAEFAEDREHPLREFLSLESGLPSHDTPHAGCSACWTLRPSVGCLRRFSMIWGPMARGFWRSTAVSQDRGPSGAA